MKTKFTFIDYGTNEWNFAVQLREEVLRRPLGSVFTQAELEEERNHHQIAGYQGDTLVATAVLVPEGDEMKMQRVAVVESLRGMNIGSEMMTFCENFASDRNFTIMYCHARDSAVNFYIKNGYTRMGPFFDEDGIPHLKMIKKL